MSQVKIIDILAFYDIPQVILAEDDSTRYIGVMQPNEEEYLMVSISDESLELFRSGKIDLLSILTNNIEENNYFRSSFDYDDSNILNIEPIDIIDLEKFTFPESGFYLK